MTTPANTPSYPYAFTPIQKRIMDLLSDGKMYPLSQGSALHKCLYDQLGPPSNVKNHISMLRKYLRTIGQDIVTHKIGEVVHYRLIRMDPPSHVAE